MQWYIKFINIYKLNILKKPGTILKKIYLFFSFFKNPKYLFVIKIFFILLIWNIYVYTLYIYVMISEIWYPIFLEIFE